MTVQIISSIIDLRTYIDSALGINGHEAMIYRLTNEITTDRNRPAYGEDWTAYLDSLNLWNMVEGWEKE